jgi:hypothetical protein
MYKYLSKVITMSNNWRSRSRVDLHHDSSISNNVLLPIHRASLQVLGFKF